MPTRLTSRLSGSLLAAAASLAVPACLHTHETFEPIEHRFNLEGQRAEATVDLSIREPLHLEFELSVQAPGEAEAGIVLRLNGQQIAKVAPDTLYVFQRIRVSVPWDAVRVGPNRLDVEAYGGPGARAELRARLHNYSGINPRFPRVFVVSDEAARLRWARQPLAIGVGRFVAFYLASLLMLWVVARRYEQRGRSVPFVTLVAPSVLVCCVWAYSLATSQHLWLSGGALVVAVLVPSVIVPLASWARSHRVVLARLTIVALVTFIGTEIVFRLYNRLHPTFIFYSDAYDRYRPRAGTRYFDTALDSRGFNDIEYAREKPAGVTRVIAIGDSFTSGVVPYAANYLTLLEQDLSAEAPIEVLNMGIPGTEPKDYLSILVKEGLAFDPDVVLLGFYIGNDFEMATRQLHEYSYVTTFFHFLWQLRHVATPLDEGLPGRFAEYDDEQPGFAPERFLEIEADRAKIFTTDNARFTADLARAIGYLRELQAVARRAGAELGVVLMPAEVQIDRALQDAVIRAHQSSRERFDFRRPNRLLAAALTSSGMPVLDLLPAFEQAGRSARLYKPQDTHWNIAGNRLAAETIAPFLRQLLSRGRPP